MIVRTQTISFTQKQSHMKKTWLIAGAALLLGAWALKPAEVLPIGSALPKADREMMDISGKKISMKGAARKNGLLVMFSCNTCPYVVKNEERTVAISQYAQKYNVGVILLNSNAEYLGGEDSYEAMKSYAASLKYNWHYVIDENHEVADAFGANRTPECFLFNSDLKLVYHGAIDDNPSDASSVKRQHLKEAIDEMNAGKDISVKESRSVGCTIKRKKA